MSYAQQIVGGECERLPEPVAGVEVLNVVLDEPDGAAGGNPAPFQTRMTVTRGKKGSEKKEGVFGQLRRGDAFIMLRNEDKFDINEDGTLDIKTVETLVCSGFFRSMKRAQRPVLTYHDVVRKRQMREYCLKGDVLVKCNPDFASAYRMANKL